MHRALLLSATVIVAVLAVPSVSRCAPPKTSREYLRLALQRVKQLYESQKWAAAGTAYRRVLFVSSGNGTAKKRLREINHNLADELVAPATAVWKQDQQIDLYLFKRAHRTDFGSKSVKAAFKKIG